MRKALVIGIAALVLLAGLLGRRLLFKPPKIIGEDIKVYEVVKKDEPVGVAYVVVPYQTRSQDYEWINIRLDANGDGRFEDDEWLVKNSWATIKTDLPDAFYFDSPFKDSRPKNFKAQIKLSKNELKSFKEKGVLSERVISEVSVFDYTQFQDHEEHPDFVDDLEDVSVQSSLTVFAQDTPRDKGVFHQDVPDLTQPKTSGSCVVYSTANSFLWLAKKHGYKNEVFEKDSFNKYTDLTARLIDCLEWDPRRGVKRSKIIKGKECFIKRFKLPLEAHEVTWSKQGKVGENILDALFAELKRGQDVELGLSLFKGGKKTGGHMVTLVGVKGKKIKVHDPANGKQTDEYEVDSEGALTGYRVFKDSDKAVIVATFAESPKAVKEEPKVASPEGKLEEKEEGPKPSPSPEPTPTPTPTPTPSEEKQSEPDQSPEPLRY